MKIQEIQLHKIDLETRLPFRYGIARMTSVTHIFLTAAIRINDRDYVGIAADHLPPRWFTKDPTQSIDEEVQQLLNVIRKAALDAREAAVKSPFAWWLAAYQAQMNWAKAESIPPLLAHFGVTLIERAVIDASIQAAGMPFHSHLLSGGLGFDPSSVHSEMKHFDWKSCFAAKPATQLIVRHTIGLEDPIENEDIPSEEKIEDGLPQSLEEAIRLYGLFQFKIKLSGNPDRDASRLEKLFRCIEKNCHQGFAFSLDGNECYDSPNSFIHAWENLSRLDSLARNKDRLLFIEQPIHRNQALNTRNQPFGDLPLNPMIIIDESDSQIESFGEALSLGYSGTSHKNCKGIFKGLLSKCLIGFRQSLPKSRKLILSGEDLANIGPVALLQDLIVMASLGISSVERNGHHYFKGLAAFPEFVNEGAVNHYPDLYTANIRGYSSLQIESGVLQTQSLQSSRFGPSFEFPLDFAETIPLVA